MNGLWGQVGLVAFGLVIGAGIGFLVARYFMKRELEKNPPLNETVIFEMMSQMGRKPSQKQVQAVMKASQKATTEASKKKKK